MQFIKVSAMPCNNTGSSRGQVTRQFYLNIDLIGGISENSIWLKNSEIVCLNGTYFRDIKLVENISPKDL
ncbi:hypothetical protein ACNQGB_11550 [Flavobacterium sp. XS1P32]|uniref:hypothetical protein n=1 Tax=Flavobacterium sp. XS1P32 TaxID=3401726 RepID=UPI003AAD0BC7